MVLVLWRKGSVRGGTSAVEGRSETAAGEWEKGVHGWRDWSVQVSGAV